MNKIEPTPIRRSQLLSLLLLPLGYEYWGLEHTDGGFIFFGKGGRKIPFSELAGLPKIATAFGFKAVSFPLKNSSEVKLVGLNHKDAVKLIASAESALFRYYSEIIDESANELQSLAEAIERLDDPRRYPSACLLQAWAA